MERLIFTDRKTSNTKITIAQEAFTALLVSIGTFLCMSDLFGFSYSIKNCFEGGIAGGLVRTWNIIADALGGSDYLLLTHYAGQSDGNGLFLTICVILGAVAAGVMIHQKNLWALLVFSVPAVMINLLTELRISQYSAACLILSLLFAVLYIKSEGQGFFCNFIMVILIGTVIYSAFQLPGISSFAGRPDFIRNIQEKTAEFTGKLYYGENPLKSGNLTERERSTEDETALEITMECPQSMYLRGFTGDLYTGDAWIPLADQNFYDVSEQMKWHEKNGFNTLGQLGEAKRLSGKDSKPGRVDIKAVKADKRYAYVPYEIDRFTDNPPVVKGGVSTAAAGLKKLGHYTYTAAENATEDWTETAGRIFTEADKNRKNEKELNQYFIEESNYNTYVYSDFTYLSAVDKHLLKNEIGSSGDQSKGHIDYKYAIRKITKYLDDNFIYTEKLGRKPEDKTSALQEFLTKKKGYDVQYATAATLMFRYYGIPARYVEGYLVTPEDVKDADKNETIRINQKRAHAWTEIYIDGVGFVPIETCPEYKDVMVEADMTVGISNNTLLRKFEEPKKQNNNQGESENGGDDKDIPEYHWIIVVAIVGLLIFALLIYILCRLIRFIIAVEKRHHLFRKAEPKTAVSAIYGYMEQKNYPVSDETRELGNKAAYSKETITEKERCSMLAALKKGKQQAEKQQKHNHKKIMKVRIK